MGRAALTEASDGRRVDVDARLLTLLDALCEVASRPEGELERGPGMLLLEGRRDPLERLAELARRVDRDRVGVAGLSAAQRPSDDIRAAAVENSSHPVTDADEHSEDEHRAHGQNDDSLHRASPPFSTRALHRTSRSAPTRSRPP